MNLDVFSMIVGALIFIVLYMIIIIVLYVQVRREENNEDLNY